MARASGLTVSALRFYDGAGVLGPAHVDPRSGYRSYAPEQLVVARLVASLRRVGMPLAGIREVLAHRHDPDAVDALLAGHLHRLEQGVAAARRELSTVRDLLAPEETPVTPTTPTTPTTVTVDAPALAAALRTVRFAVGSDPEFPVLHGVLLDVGPEVLTVVATDRYRVAVASVPVLALDGPARSVVVPPDLPAGDGVLRVDDAAVTVGGTAHPLVEGAFPDHRRLLPAPSDRGVAVEAAELRAAVAAGGTRRVAGAQVTVLAVDGAGRLVVGAGHDGVGVNAEFLLEAVDAGGPGPLRLELDGPLAPVALRSADAFSLLMPVRLDEPEAAPTP
ncbi:MerR family transcriptional regulator [Pseudonocardia broussonetiae]|uniref:MerR family transcriptional regulator n=2 Tax=Pseudonocardia broussonetiae TaxID=2736640 RepID=A0A6M6JWD3_9PSEU|nr:MerR family transcriptional regulator [Pseudonocardia broussonetiae]